MSGQGGLISEEVAPSPAGPTAEPQVATKTPQDSNSIEERRKITEEDEEKDDLNNILPHCSMSYLVPGQCVHFRGVTICFNNIMTCIYT